MPHLYQVRLQQAWTNPDAYASSLLLLFLDRFGVRDPDAPDEPSPLEWDPDTIRMEIEQEIGVPIPVLNLDRLMAAIAVVTTDLFWRDLPSFISLVNILDRDLFDPHQFDPADVEECAWAITEATLLDPPESESPFSEEIVAYIRETMKASGLIQPPRILRFAAENPATEYSFTEDPELFAGAWEHGVSRSKEIDDMVQNRLREMIDQIQQLPLQHGQTANLAQKLMEH